MKRVFGGIINGNLDEKVLEKEDSVEKHDKGKYILQSEFNAAVEYIKRNKASMLE